MTDYATSFAANIELGTDEEKMWWKNELEADIESLFPSNGDGDYDVGWGDWCEARGIEEGYTPDDIEWPGFEWSFSPEGNLWVRSWEGGRPEYVANLAHLFLKKFEKNKEYISFQGADTCSKLHSDGFGGYCFFATAEGVEMMATGIWADERAAEFQEKVS